MATFRIRQAADLLGVSDDTVRRWIAGGRLASHLDTSGRRVVDGVDLAHLAEELADEAVNPAEDRLQASSVRNRMPGLVTRVVKDTVMAQVEIQAGPFRIVSLMSRMAADELGLEPGVLAVAGIKSTHVTVEVPDAH